jgi:hypothetical protein
MNQEQREALIDLLVLSIFTDSYLSLREDEALQSALAAVGWDADKPREIFICNSMSRARRATDNDGATASYVSKRTAAFTDAASQATALDLLKRVLASDGMAPAEQTFLDKVQAAFPHPTTA